MEDDKLLSAVLQPKAMPLVNPSVSGISIPPPPCSSPPRASYHNAHHRLSIYLSTSSPPPPPPPPPPPLLRLTVSVPTFSPSCAFLMASATATGTLTNHTRTPCRVVSSMRRLPVLEVDAAVLPVVSVFSLPVGRVSGEGQMGKGMDGGRGGRGGRNVPLLRAGGGEQG